MRARSRWWLVAGVAGLLLALALGSSVRHRHEQPFDRKVWVSGKAWALHNPRQPMVQSLLRTQHLVGRTRRQVISLLGPPDGVDGRVTGSLMVSQASARQAKQFDYLLGTSCADYDFLSLHFDAHGRVVGWRRWQGR